MVNAAVTNALYNLCVSFETEREGERTRNGDFENDRRGLLIQLLFYLLKPFRTEPFYFVIATRRTRGAVLSSHRRCSQITECKLGR